MLSQSALSIIAMAPPRRRLDCANVIGSGGSPGEGPFITLYFHVEDRIVRDSSYECNGCPSSTASACLVLRLVHGRKLDEFAQLNGRDVELILGGLPDGKGFYADLAAEAIRNAIGNLP